MPASAPTSAHYYRQLLMQGKWFSEIAPALQEKLLDLAVIRKLKDEERLFYRGDPPCGVYAVIEGVVRASRTGGNSDSAKEATTGIIGPPDWFGEISLFDAGPRTHDVSANGPAVLLYAPQQAMYHLLTRHPEYWRDFGKLMSNRLRYAFILSEETTLYSTPERLILRLLGMADGVGGLFRFSVPSQRKNLVRLSQEQLASMLGITRQTANQILKSLEKQEIILLHRSEIEILDLERLRALVPLSN